MSAIATLLTSESYLAGALTLAHTLRHHGTRHQLVALVDETQLLQQSIRLLEAAYDKLVSISGHNPPADVQDRLGRPELAATFAKVHLWNQLYAQILYLDCDVLPLCNVDHLLDDCAHLSPQQVAASPDAGWPDIFNLGVMVLQPDPQVYADLVDFAADGSNTFDGADQGLLNEFFAGKWHRLPFLYNVTPTESYQYVPAFHRFFDNIKILHYIGAPKPWHTRDVDHFRFHHLWWDRFDQFFEGETRTHILATTGAAARLHIPRLVNQWDDDHVQAAASTYADAAPVSEIAAVFPWEHRGAQPATRVFDREWGNAESEAAVREPKVAASAAGNIETSMRDMKVGAPKPSGLKKKYEFKDRSDFNPDESLDRVTQLPAQLMSKFNKQ